MPSITASYCALLGICPAFVQRIELHPVETLLIDTNPRTGTTIIEIDGADEGTRTLDLRFTKPLLFRLSYIGVPN